MPEAADIAWASGLIEGEGCFSIHKRKNRPSTTSCAIHVEMTDKEPVERIRDIFGVGTVCERPSRRNRKPTWIWSVQRQSHIFDVLLRIGPYLQPRRRKKAAELFDFLEAKICQ